ncbi:MAG TPA: hypothetical protein VEF05_11010 [Terriglobales bacterium]|nr:hypothetical protein [Terriglobales bacterium]
MRSKLITLAALLATASAVFVCGEQAPSESPIELVRQTVDNEIRSNNGGAKLMFKGYRETPRGSQNKLIAETKDGTAGLLVAVDGKPLTPQQREAEEARLDGLMHNPAELKKKQKAEREDTERTTRIMKALPDAFLYQRDGREIGSEGIGKPGDELVRLSFRPNPKYNPPSHTEQVLTGMRGYILIDVNLHRIAKIDGTLSKEVGFGWGILGHLDKGGRFVVQQGVVGEGDWEVTRMDLSFTGRELLLKKLVIKSKETFTDFRPAPSNLSFAQAVELLKKQQAELAENHQQNGPANHDPH